MAANAKAIVHWVPDHHTLRTICDQAAGRRRCVFGNVKTIGGPTLTRVDVTCKACLAKLALAECGASDTGGV
jgi:hypothetical protein